MLAVSTGAIFARLAHAPALLISASRTTIAALLLGAWVVASRQWTPEPVRSRWGLLAVSATFLAIHFATWISSLELTTVASSLVLVNTAPIWVALAAPRFTGDKVSLQTAIGIGLGVVGTIVVGHSDFGASGNQLLGDALALAGGLAAAGYVLAGRRARQELSLPVYASLTYGGAGVLLWIAVVGFNVRVVGLSSGQWGWIALIGLVPQLIGHSAYNWALGYLSAPLVSVSLIGEPIVASLLAWVIFHEQPSGQVLVGGLAILAGIVVAACQRSR